MPLIYRAMTRDNDKPLIGSTGRTLGVRAGDDPDDDIPVDAEDNVAPNTGGMSATPSWRQLQIHRIPRRLKHLAPGAVGSNRDACWRMGEGTFEESKVTDELILRPDSAEHGVVEPLKVVSLGEYRFALANTQSQWTIDEA